VVPEAGPAKTEAGRPRQVELVVADTAEAAARAAAEELAAAASAGVHVALAGGATPRPAYELAARLPLVFLGLIAVLPLVLQGFTRSQALTIGGTGLLIVVSVILESMKQIDAQLTMREYESA
jgi:hypothetical protein